MTNLDKILDEIEQRADSATSGPIDNEWRV